MTQGIYKFVNKQDGKAYIGSSADTERRGREHRQMLCAGHHYNPHFQHAWDKYGEDVFEFRVMEEVKDVDMLLVAEQKYLDACVAQGNCYNIAITAGPAGPKSEEHKRKISDGMIGNQNCLGRVVSDETRRKQSKALSGKKHTEEHRRKNSEARIGKKLTDEARRNMSKAKTGPLHHMWGKHHTNETRRKISEAQIGELSHSWGKHPTEETLRKRSESMKRWWARKRAESLKDARQCTNVHPA